MMDLHDAPSKHPAQPLAPYTVVAEQLRPGDRIRDRGNLHTIDVVGFDGYLDGSVTVTMDDGGSLTIERPQPVTIWR